ncbi:unnamed protein product [Penicillium bialowiezense]
MSRVVLQGSSHSEIISIYRKRSSLHVDYRDNLVPEVVWSSRSGGPRISTPLPRVPSPESLNQKSETMGSSSVFAKTILIPAAIALTIYILASCVIIPFFRRYHQRYSQYLPLHSISAHTLSLRDRVADTVMNFFLRSTWRRDADVADNDNISIDEQEGEALVGMDMNAVRRGALERRQDVGAERLGRDLEEGFMDDSDSEGHAHA